MKGKTTRGGGATWREGRKHRHCLKGVHCHLAMPKKGDKRIIGRCPHEPPRESLGTFICLEGAGGAEEGRKVRGH